MAENVETLTVTILREIRDEIRATNERLDTTNERLDTTNERLDRVERRQVESEVRLSTAVLALGQTLIEVRDLLKDRSADRGRLTRVEARVETLERKVG
jgi:DNA repair ATPase RecN